MPTSETWTGLVDDPIHLGAVHDHLADDRAGGVWVFVGMACPHRAEAFAAARWLIDTLKDTVPVWKTEHAPDHG